MTRVTERLPQLFGWGRCGVPGEITSYIASVETTVRIERGESFPNGRDSSGFQSDGVERIASNLLSELRDRRAESAQSPKVTGHNARLTGDIAGWVYLLHAYCAREGKPAPPALLWLTFEALDQRENRPPAEILEKFSMPNVKNIHQFLEAASLDGEADAKGTKLALSELERVVGVSRQTLRAWRQMRQYRDRREFCAYRAGKVFPTSDGVRQLRK